MIGSACLLFAYVAADIMVHCEYRHIKGSWTFYHTGLAPLPKIGQPMCMHTAPDLRVNVMRLSFYNQSELYNYPHSIKVELTDHVVKRKDKNAKAEFSLVAAVEGGEDGSWTVASDEGFEVRLGGKSFFAYNFFSCPDCRHPASNINSIGMDMNGLYERYGFHSHCDRTFVGSYLEEGPDGTLQHGCFYGVRDDADPVQPVSTSSQTDPWKMYANSPRRGVETHRAVPGLTKKDGLVDRMCDFDEGNDGEVKAELDSLYPEGFDWRHDPVIGSSWTDKPAMQTCGTCYAYASVWALQSQINIKLAKEKKLKDGPIVLDVWPFVMCSQHNQGCDGGYPFTAFRSMKENGVPEYKRQDISLSRLSLTMERTCTAKLQKRYVESPVWYAKDYGYVGGFAGMCSQYKLMKFISEHGPVSFIVNNGPLMQQAVQMPRTSSLVEVEISRRGALSLDKTRRGMEKLGESYGVNIDTTGQTRHFDEEIEMRVEFQTPCARDVNKANALEAAARSMQNKGFNAVVEEDSLMVSPGTAQDVEIYTPVTRSLKAAVGDAAAQCLHVTVSPAHPHSWGVVTHAMAILGWGEDKRMGPYWIIRNSYGALWKGTGYAKVPRGQDLGSIETFVTWGSIDWSRGAALKYK